MRQLLKQNQVTIILAIIAIALAFLTFTPFPAVAQSVTGIYFDLGGNRLVVRSGAQVVVESGGQFLPTPGATVIIPNYAVTPQPTATPPGNLNATAVVADSVRANTAYVTSTLTAPNVVATAIVANSVSVAGTPVFWATPAAVGGLYRSCGQTVITGTGTIAHGLATPSYVTYGIAQDVTGDGARLSHTNSAATVTIKGWNALQTPAAATTPVTVDWCVFGTK